MPKEEGGRLFIHRASNQESLTSAKTVNLENHFREFGDACCYIRCVFIIQMKHYLFERPNVQTKHLTTLLKY